MPEEETKERTMRLSPLKIAVCEDDTAQRRSLERLVEQWAGQKGLQIRLFACADCETFLFAWEERMDFDLLLLDIELGAGMDGMHLARRIRGRDERLAIVFITGLPEYMSQGYDVQALHFLIKPVEERRLWEILDRALERTEKKEAFLLLERGTEPEVIPVSSILYVEAFSHACDIYVLENQKAARREVRMGMKEIQERLPSSAFVRCHRSYLVHLAYVRKICRNQVFLEYVDALSASRGTPAGRGIPVSRGKERELYEAFLAYHKSGNVG